MTVAELLYNPYDYALHEDPYPLYRRMRDEAPVYRNEAQGFWALSRHEDVVAAFRDSARFSSSHGVSLDPAASGPHAHRTMSFLAMDEPMHGRMRGLVSRGFTPRRVAEMEPHIRELTRRYLDRILEERSIDFIGDLAGRLPMDVISELIGVPAADRDEVRGCRTSSSTARRAPTTCRRRASRRPSRSSPTTRRCWPSAAADGPAT